MTLIGEQQPMKFHWSKVSGNGADKSAIAVRASHKVMFTWVKAISPVPVYLGRS